MRKGNQAHFVLVIAVLGLLVTACDIPIGLNDKRQPATRVLLIGNSYTAYNGGIDKQLSGLDPSIETQRIDATGATLESHWNNGNALQAIRNGRFAYVVLQEQSQTPIVNQNAFYTYARYFITEITSRGGTTILLMTWERPDSVRAGVTTTNLANAYNSLGTMLGARVAPAGIAFARSLGNKPGLTLYAEDGHPTIYGTYLAACVVYGMIRGRSPVGNPYAEWSISQELKMYLQQIAAEALGF